MIRIAAIIAFLGLLFFIGCDIGTQQRLNCICLIDYSGGLSPQMLHRCAQIISSDILQHLGEKDRIVVLPIGETAKTVAVKLVYEDLAEKRFSYPTDGYTHAKDSLRKRILQYAATTGPKIYSQLIREMEVRKKNTSYTDIFSALEQVEALVERNEPDDFWRSLERFVTGRKKIESSNIIVIFSDMIQESDESSFAEPRGFTREEAHAIIERLRFSNRIPDLRDCRVFVNGGTGKSNLQVGNIKNFWVAYFKETQAELSAYDSDAGNQITSYLNQRLAPLR